MGKVSHTLLVIFALVTISLVQYNWVVSSAATDFSELYLSLTYSLEQQVIQSLRDSPIFSKRFLFLDSRVTSEEALEELSDYLLMESDEYIRGVYYMNLFSKRVISWDDDSWIEDNTLFPYLASIPSELRHPPGEVFFIEDEKSRDNVWVILTISDRREAFFILNIDLELYLKQLLEGVYEKSITGYDVVILDSLPEGASLIGQDEYRYSVFQRGKWVSEISLLLPMLPERDLRVDHQFIHRPPRDKGTIPWRSLYIDLQDDGVSLITREENVLTFQWIGIFILLLSIGAAYILVVYQISGLKRLRLREKEFIATVTHELRTPVTVIQSAANNLECGFLKPERVKEYGSLINSQSTRLSSMIEGILLFSRLESRVERKPPLDIVYFSVLEESLNIYAQSICSHSGHLVSVDFTGLPKCAVTDGETIELILTNLISNSNKHGFEEGEKGRISVQAIVIEGEQLQFIIHDNGIGLDSYDRKHIFDPFYRGKRSHRLQINGSGLGLYLSRKKAELIDGTLKVESEKGRGTTFYLTLPYIREDKE